MICKNIEECFNKQIEKKSVESCVNKEAECIEVSDDCSLVKCEERKKKYVLENTKRNHVVLYRMDGGVISQDKTTPQGTCKCDYLFAINGKECDAILTELKGVDVLHSLKQIDGTLNQFRGFFLKFSHVYGRVVVSSSVPNIRTNPSYVNLVKKLHNYGGNLKIFEMKKSEKDIDLSKK